MLSSDTGPQGGDGYMSNGCFSSLLTLLSHVTVKIFQSHMNILNTFGVIRYTALDTNRKIKLVLC